MDARGLLKRFLPFFLTFATGLFIASFFVPIIPRFNYERGDRRNRQCRQMIFENQSQRDEIQRLRQENADLKRLGAETDRAFEFESDVPPPPMAPVRPVAPRHVR
jgi:hypothetical protein